MFAPFSTDASDEYDLEQLRAGHHAMSQLDFIRYIGMLNEYYRNVKHQINCCVVIAGTQEPGDVLVSVPDCNTYVIVNVYKDEIYFFIYTDNQLITDRQQLSDAALKEPTDFLQKRDCPIDSVSCLTRQCMTFGDAACYAMLAVRASAAGANVDQTMSYLNRKMSGNVTIYKQSLGESQSENAGFYNKNCRFFH